MRFSFSLSVNVFLPVLLGHVGLAFPRPRSELIPPSEDSFYNIPSDIGHYKPGAVIRSRQVDDIAAFSTLPQNIKKAHQLLYRTTDNHGNATATVSTILVPHNANFSRVLSYQIAEDSSWLDCAPSYLMRRYADSGRGIFGGLYTWTELLLVDAALEQGWVVNSPDHLGHSASFLADLQSGYATLDSIRALYATRNETGINADPDVALWGYSGGSIASGFASEMLSTYAPDVRLIGAAIGGTVPSIENAMADLNAGALAGLVPNGIIGLTKVYPDLKALIDKLLKPETAADFNKAASQCLVASLEQFFRQNIYDYFIDGEAFLSDPLVRNILATNDAGHGTPTIPMFVYKSIHDEVSSISYTDGLVDQYCSGGTPITYHRDELSEHLILLVTGAPDALLWLRDRFNGVPVSPSCSKENVVTSLENKGALEVLGSAILKDLKGLIGQPIGPDSRIRFGNNSH